MSSTMRLVPMKPKLAVVASTIASPMSWARTALTIDRPPSGPRILTHSPGPSRTDAATFHVLKR